MDTQNRKEMQQIVAAVERGEGENKKSFWTRVGVAFKNKDGKSWNLRFDYFPARPEITIQLRPFNPKDEAQPEDQAA
jgi:hypothetical protein